ncbi:MAG: hypothetical protein HY534_04445 [Chloroflexi bacterium]|nr:hypothetical protein [Chloroflexota bacterium]
MSPPLGRAVLTGVLVLGALSGFIERGTFAYFTDSATSATNTFAAGTIDLENTPSSALITFSNMIPGDKVTTQLTISNEGTLDMRYAVSDTVTNTDSKGLGAQLTLTIKVDATCDSDNFDSGGTVVYGPDSPLGTLGSSRNIIGTPGSTPNGGRTVTSGGADVLCLQVKLPSSTGTSYAGASTTATFSISAESL